MEHLDRLTGGAEAQFFPVGPPEQAPRITSIVYRDLPEPGHLTAFTYGLSLVEHDAWRNGRPELSISIRSDDRTWGQAVGYLAASLAGACPFSYGDVIDFGEPITADTRLSAFVVFAPMGLDREHFLSVLGAPEGSPAEDVVNVAGMYPIHASEMAFIGSQGLEAFWRLDWDPYDPQREPAV